MSLDALWIGRVGAPKRVALLLAWVIALVCAGYWLRLADYRDLPAVALEVPETIGVDELLERVSRLGHDVSIEQMLPVEGCLRLSLSGSYPAVQAFLLGVGALAVMPERLRMLPVERGQVRLELALRYGEAGPVVPAERQDPFGLGPHVLLEQYSLEQMEWVGSVQDSTASIVLVRVEGQVHPVRQGDVIGKERHRLLRFGNGKPELAPVGAGLAGES